jgi:peptidoglycan/LPS O-acetylase OafA/YrhL
MARASDAPDRARSRKWRVTGPNAATSIPKLGYVPQLDGLRALAIGAVLLLHASVSRFPGGWVGVHIFFVLSGYLITSLLLQEWDRSGGIGLGRFWVRRVLRLVPAYWLMLLIFVLTYVPTASAAGRPALWHEYWIALTYRTNFMFDQAPHLGFTWTLAMEEQFYLVWPVVLLVLLRRGVSRHKILLITGLLCLAVVGWRIYLLLSGASQGRLDTGPDVQSDALLIGCIAAQVQRRPDIRRIVAHPALPWAVLLLIALFVLTINSGDRWIDAGALTAVSVLVALMLLHLVQHQHGVARRLLASRHAVVLGKISYSLYLWNVFALALARNASLGAAAATALGLVLALVAAAVTYRLVEVPLRRVRRKLLRETA